ncbi:MAG: exosortase/archaeosortase family protein [Chthoniobacterales bacterium]
MEIQAADPSSPAFTPSAPGRPVFRMLAVGLFLGALWFILCRQLSNEWSANEQYSYGWFVPFFAAFLFWLRLEEAETIRNAKVEIRKWQRSHFLRSTCYFLLLAALLPVRLFEIGNPDWRPLDWVHAFVVVALTLLVIYYWGGLKAVRHFAFPVAFIFVAVPWITPIEAPIVQGLMRIVAAIATETLALLGIPAQLEGSVIRIGSGVVGVSEACSGVRSLQTSLMIGLLFGELKRLSVSRRLALVVAAAGLAFVANCARTFFLVWIASRDGLPAVTRWHDPAGYSILGLVFLGTMGLAALLAKEKLEGRTEKKSVRRSQDNNSRCAFRARQFLPSTSYFLLSLFFLLAVEAGADIWYRAHEHNLIHTATWTVRWPENALSFQKVPITDDARSTRRYDTGREARWLAKVTPRNLPASWSMFFFRWEPGTTSILRARAHRPDVCLPNTGWQMTQDFGVKNYAVAGSAAIPFRHFSFTQATPGAQAATAHAFFCEHEDRVPRAREKQLDFTAGTTNSWARSDRLRVVLEGSRNQGQQVLELVLLTPTEITGPEAEAEFARLVPEIVRIDPKPPAP